MGRKLNCISLAMGLYCTRDLNTVRYLKYDSTNECVYAFHEENLIKMQKLFQFLLFATYKPDPFMQPGGYLQD